MVRGESSFDIRLPDWISQDNLMPAADRVPDPHPTFVIRLVLHFYNGFLLLAATLAVVSLGVTMFGLSQADELSGSALMAVALLASAAITAIVAVTIVGVLQFVSQSVHGRYERSDLIMSWVPLFLFDVVMLQAIAGLLLWFTNNFPNDLVVLFASELLVFLVVLIMVSVWVRRKINAFVVVAYLDENEAEGLCCDQARKQEDEVSILGNGFSRSTTEPSWL